MNQEWVTCRRRSCRKDSKDLFRNHVKEWLSMFKRTVGLLVLTPSSDVCGTDRHRGWVKDFSLQTKYSGNIKYISAYNIPMFDNASSELCRVYRRLHPWWAFYGDWYEVPSDSGICRPVADKCVRQPGSISNMWETRKIAAEKNT